MALLNCPQCGGQVSSDAATCPHCGAPRKKSGTGPWTVIGWIALLVVLLPVAGCIAAIAVGQYRSYQERSRSSVEASTTAAPATSPAPAGTCGAGDVLVSGTAGRIERHAIFVTGVLENRCSIATGAQVKFTVYSSSGQVLTSRDLWPASVSNIPANGTFPFEIQLDKVEGADRFEAQVIRVKAWD